MMIELAVLLLTTKLFLSVCHCYCDCLFPYSRDEFQKWKCTEMDKLLLEGLFSHLSELAEVG